MKKTYYIASWKQGENEGIKKIVYDKQENILYSKELINDCKRSSYFQRNNDYLYVLTETPMASPNQGQFSVYKMSKDNLEFISKTNYIDSGITHLAISKDNKHLYGSGYGTGTITTCDIDVNNNLINAKKSYSNIGSSINELRQKSSHFHFSLETNDNYRIFCDLGTDELLIFKVDENGDLYKTNSIKTPLGYGPRHAIFSLDYKFLYVLCEMSYHLLVYSYTKDGQLELLNDVDLWPELEIDKRACSAIKISADGKYLFTGNRGKNYSSIDCFDLSNPIKPKKISSYLDTDFPRDFTLLDDGYIAICEQQNNAIRFIQFKDNRFIFTGLIQDIEMPACIIEY